jgi:Tol biopolymer transport system component
LSKQSSAPNPSVEEYATLSPDGNQVAFSGNVEAHDNFDIYVKVIGSESLLRITRDPAPDAYPIWSPDGRWIAFVRAGKKVMLVSPLGGPERTIFEGEVRTCTWSPDSTSVVVSSKLSNARGSADSVSIATGERKKLIEDATYPITISRDGRQIAYAVRKEGGSRLYVAPLSPGLQVGNPRFIDLHKADVELLGALGPKVISNSSARSSRV